MKEYLDKHPVLHSLFHAGMSLVIFGIPVLMQLLPKQWMDLTLSGALTMILHWLENKEEEV